MNRAILIFATAIWNVLWYFSGGPVRQFHISAQSFSKFDIYCLNIPKLGQYEYILDLYNTMQVREIIIYSCHCQILHFF
jgi:hypothetical protein